MEKLIYGKVLEKKSSIKEIELLRLIFLVVYLVYVYLFKIMILIALILVLKYSLVAAVFKNEHI